MTIIIIIFFHFFFGGGGSASTRVSLCMSEARVHNFCLWQYLSEPFFVFFILSYLFFTPRPIPPPPSNRPLPPLKFCMGSQETKIPKFWAPERPTAHFFSWGQDDQNFKPGALMAICYNLLCFYLSWVVFGCFLSSFLCAHATTDYFTCAW